MKSQPLSLLRTAMFQHFKPGKGGQKTHSGSFPPDLQDAADGAAVFAGEAPAGCPPAGVREALRVPHQAGGRTKCAGVEV